MKAEGVGISSTEQDRGKCDLLIINQSTFIEVPLWARRCPRAGTKGRGVRQLPPVQNQRGQQNHSAGKTNSVLMQYFKKLQMHREQTYGCQGGGGVAQGWSGNLRLEDANYYVKNGKKQGPTV